MKNAINSTAHKSNESSISAPKKISPENIENAFGMQLDLCDSIEQIEIEEKTKSLGRNEIFKTYSNLDKSLSDSEDTREYLEKNASYLNLSQNIKIDADIPNARNLHDTSHVFISEKAGSNLPEDENCDDTTLQLKRYYSSWETYESHKAGFEIPNDIIPKAIIQRTLQPEKLNNADRRNDLAELFSKIDSSRRKKKSKKPSIIKNQIDKSKPIIATDNAEDLPLTIEPFETIEPNVFDPEQQSTIDQKNINTDFKGSESIVKYSASSADIHSNPGNDFYHLQHSIGTKLLPDYIGDGSLSGSKINKYQSGYSMYDTSYQPPFDDRTYTCESSFIDPNGNMFFPQNVAFNSQLMPRNGFYNNYRPRNFNPNRNITAKTLPYIDYPVPMNMNMNNRFRSPSYTVEDSNINLDFSSQLNFPSSKLSSNFIQPNFNVPVAENEAIEFDLSKSTLELAKDQHGSRLIQQKLEQASKEEIEKIIRELTADQKEFVILMGDVFGNYVIQKLLDFGFESHRLSIISKIKGYVLNLSLQMYGCRVIQKAIECVPVHAQISLVSELYTHVLDCIKDQNGNHVIQKCIERIDPLRLSFIIKEISGQVLSLAAHPYGCRVIQRIMEHFDLEQKSIVTDELFINLPLLICDQYGNYVVQHILDHSFLDKYREYIFTYVKNNLFFLSCHKFASNVVEKCLTCGTKEERGSLAYEIILKSTGSEDDIVFKMMKDAYANYVIQKLLDVLISDKENDLFYAFVAKIKPHYPNLRKINYGKHIISKIDKICSSVSPRSSSSSNLKSKYNSSNSEFVKRQSAGHSPPNNYSHSRLKGEFLVNKSNAYKSIILDNLTEFPSLTRESKSVSSE